MKNKILLKLFLLGFILTLCNSLFAQVDEGTKLDLLKAPASPAASLLKFATTDIEKPSDLSALMLSLQSASSSFTALPSNYAIDLAPYWLFRTNTDFTTNGLASTKYKDVFRQTFVVSFAIKNVDSIFQNFKPKNTYGAVGFKFSFRRAQYDSNTLSVLKTIHKLQGDLNRAVYKDVNRKSLDYLKLEKKRDSIILAIKSNSISAEDGANKVKNEEKDTSSDLFITQKKMEDMNLKNINSVLEEQKLLVEELKSEAEKFEGKRIGFSWDVAGGISSEFRDKRFDNSKVFNAGLWTTAAFNGKKGFTFLLLARYLFNPEQEYEDNKSKISKGDISTIDGGARFLFSSKKSKFNASLEGLYRQAFTSFKYNQTWRLVFNADYSIWQNQKLTFSFGRDFDGTITKDGNLIAALTFLRGFGNKR